jgi:hypothetical protein
MELPENPDSPTWRLPLPQEMEGETAAKSRLPQMQGEMNMLLAPY